MLQAASTKKKDEFSAVSSRQKEDTGFNDLSEARQQSQSPILSQHECSMQLDISDSRDNSPTMDETICDDNLTLPIMERVTPSRQENFMRKKRKATPNTCDQFESQVIEYMQEKKQKQGQPEDHLAIWGKNLVESVRGIKNKKRRNLLRLDIDNLVSRIMREDLESDEDTA